MEEFVTNLVSGWPLLALFALIAACLFLLGKGADLLVDEAVSLSIRHGISKVLIGATIVSLGTTLPEVTVSVMAAVKGNPDLALGNAVGSVVCDTGLILGLATLLGKIPIERKLVNRQGLVQLGAALLLVAACLPFSHLSGVFETGGSLPRAMGFVFLALLGIYLWVSAKWSREMDGEESLEAHDQSSTGMIIVKIVAGLALIIASSDILIPTVKITAIRVGIPESIIAATLVAFGTSLPELVTCLTAVRKGHGGLAMGNVIGADILNVLFVAGAAAAVTPGGLTAGPNFFRILFPAMIGVILLFRIGLLFSKDSLAKWVGVTLLGAYAAYLVISL